MLSLEKKGVWIDHSLSYRPFLGEGELYWGKGLVGDIAEGFGDLDSIFLPFMR